MKRLIFILLMLIGTTTNAATISMTPSTNNVVLGSAFSVDILGSNFPDDTLGGGLSLTFDPIILELTSVSFTTSDFTFFNVPGTIDNVNGTLINLNVSDFLGLNGGSFQIATLEFLALGVGISTLELTGISNSPWGFGTPPVVITPINFQTASVNVAPVPIPPALGLFGLGFATLFGFRKKYRRI